jgi:hypothetical protein
MREAIAVFGERPSLLYHLACQEARAGKRSEARDDLRHAIALDPELAERVRDDEDLAGIEP